MKNRIAIAQAAVAVAAAVLVAAAAVPAPAAVVAVVQTSPQASHGWMFAGKYRSYKAACCEANQLQSDGYDTYIKMQDDCYCVYYR